MKRYCVVALAAMIFVGIMATLSVAAGSSAAPENQITMNFQNVDIPVLAKFISEITGKNFIIDESVRGKVTIISPAKVTPEQAYSMFQSVLQIKGFTTVQRGKAIEIQPSRNVRSAAPLTHYQEPTETQGDEYVTRMVKLNNVDAASMINVIQPMISHDGLIAAFPEDNTLIITDDAYNVDRLLQIIGSLDIRGTQQSVIVIPLKLAFAGELAPEIDQIMGAKTVPGTTAMSGREARAAALGGVVAPATQGTPSGFKVIPDERTNSIIVLAGPIQMREIQDIVEKLDVQSPNAMARIHVYHLKNAQALEMVQVLSNLINGGGSPGQLSPSTGKGSLGRGSTLGNYNGSASGSGFGGLGGGMSGSSSFGGSMMGSMGSSSGTSGTGSSGFGSGGGMMRTSGTSGSGSGPTSVSSNGHNPDFNAPVSITADPATNALVVSAAPQDWQTLHTIIDDLDVPRVQVFVQAVIVEVSAERAREIGMSFQSYNAMGGVNGVSQLNFGNLTNALSNPLSLTGLSLGLASGSLCNVPVAAASTAVSTVASATTGSTIQVPCDIAIMTAIETDTHANVLSAPTLLTADNEEAMIVVGENLPFVGSAAANAGLPGQIFNSVDRQNVGITLDIVPQVSEGDYVKLDLYEEVSNVVNGTQNATLGPTTTIRSASTSVLVEDHRTAVIGGLLSSQSTLNNQGVPFISNIPVIGNLFSDRASDRQKDNLIVFLTPHVIRNRDQLRSLALDERQKFVNALGRRELHDMPASQVRELYKPSFSVSVPPSADLSAPYNAAPAAPGPDTNPFEAAPPTSSGTVTTPGVATPFNTEEIGPSTMNRTGMPAAGSVASSEPPATTIAVDPGAGTPPVTAAASAPAPSGTTASADASATLAGSSHTLDAARAVVSTPPSP
jgi:general secretion pathway protein D